MNLLFRIKSLLNKRNTSDLSNQNRENQLWNVIRKVGEYVKIDISTKGYEILFVIPIGAIEIDPKYLAYWFATKNDVDRDILLNKQAEIRGLVHSYLEEEGYPLESIKYTSCTFESQETVDRDYNGNWYYAMK